MTITHVVLFQFRDGTDPEVIRKGCEQFLRIEKDCIHPQTQKPYLLSVKGGQDMSIEPHQQGNTHGFVVEFANAEDRTYYVKEDPVHRSFVATMGPLVEKITVLDFENGKY